MLERFQNKSVENCTSFLNSETHNLKLKLLGRKKKLKYKIKDNFNKIILMLLN